MNKYLSMIMERAPHIIITWFSACFLYLYYKGAWYDLNPIIEITEVVLMYVIGIIGLVMFISRARD